MWINEWISWSWVEFSRTQATDFGWDWSPALAPQGLFGSIELVSGLVMLEQPQIHSIVHLNEQQSSAELNLTLQVRSLVKMRGYRGIGEARIYDPKGNWVDSISWNANDFDLDEGINNKLVGKFSVRKAQLWKLKTDPSSQNLYNISITMTLTPINS